MLEQEIRARRSNGDRGGTEDLRSADRRDGHGSWALIGPPQIAFILGVSSVAVRTGHLPRWIGYSGGAVVVGLVVNTTLALGGLAGLGLLWVLGLAGWFLVFDRIVDGVDRPDRPTGDPAH